MTSADSLRQVLLRSSHSVRKASQGKSTIFPVIYPPHLHREFRIAWGFSLCCNLTHSHMPDAVPVRRTNGLPRASFRFHLTMDTLAFGYALGAIPCAQDFHPLDCAHAWHTTKCPLSVRTAGILFSPMQNRSGALIPDDTNRSKSLRYVLLSPRPHPSAVMTRPRETNPSGLGSATALCVEISGGILFKDRAVRIRYFAVIAHAAHFR